MVVAGAEVQTVVTNLPVVVGAEEPTVYLAELLIRGRVQQWQTLVTVIMRHRLGSKAALAV
jgi:hypothetical protein